MRGDRGSAGVHGPSLRRGGQPGRRQAGHPRHPPVAVCQTAKRGRHAPVRPVPQPHALTAAEQPARDPRAAGR